MTDQSRRSANDPPVPQNGPRLTKRPLGRCKIGIVEQMYAVSSCGKSQLSICLNQNGNTARLGGGYQRLESIWGHLLGAQQYTCDRLRDQRRGKPLGAQTRSIGIDDQIGLAARRHWQKLLVDGLPRIGHDSGR